MRRGTLQRTPPTDSSRCRWRCRRVVFWADARAVLAGLGSRFPHFRFPTANFIRPKLAFYGHFLRPEKT